MATKPDKSTVEQRIRDFLAGAPEDITPWARLTASRLYEDEGVALCISDSVSDDLTKADTHADSKITTDTKLVTPLIVTPSDEIDRRVEDSLESQTVDDADTAEVDSETDRVKQSKTTTKPTIVTPSDKPERRSSAGKAKMSAGQIAALITVAAVVVFFVVYWVGRPAQEPMDNPHGDMQAMMDKMNEEEAKMPASERAHRIAELHGILEKNPDDVKAHLEMGVLTFDQKDTASAKEHWEKVIELDPNEVAAWYNLGFLYQSLEPPQPEKAQQAWDKVVELAPDSDLARVVTMHSEALKDPDAALQRLNKAPGNESKMPGKMGQISGESQKPPAVVPRDSGEAR